MTGQGVSSRSSHSAAAGRTTPSAKPCTQSRMSFWSCDSSSEKGGLSPLGASACSTAACPVVASMRVSFRLAGYGRLAAGEAQEAPGERCDEAGEDSEDDQVGADGEDGGDALLLLALEVLLVANERAREAPARRDLLDGDRRVGGHVDRHAGDRRALVQAKRRLPVVVDRDRLGGAVDAGTDLLQLVDDAAAALPGGGVEPFGIVGGIGRIKLYCHVDAALGGRRSVFESHGGLRAGAAVHRKREGEQADHRDARERGRPA